MRVVSVVPGWVSVLAATCLFTSTLALAAPEDGKPDNGKTETGKAHTGQQGAPSVAWRRAPSPHTIRRPRLAR